MDKLASNSNKPWKGQESGRITVLRVATIYYLHVKFPTRNYEACKEMEKYGKAYILGKEQGTETVCDQISHLTEKDSKIAIINMFTEQRKAS